MVRRAALIFAAAITLAACAYAQDVTFRKSKITDANGKERKVDLIFEGDGKTITVRQKKNAIAIIPHSALDQIAYSFSKRRRVKEGAQVMTSGCTGGIACLAVIPVSVVGGSVIMLTKTKTHWFYIDYTDVNGPRQVILRLDKDEYQKILDIAKTRTGKEVNILPEE
jgi:hypothetical protein